MTKLLPTKNTKTKVLKKVTNNFKNIRPVEKNSKVKIKVYTSMTFGIKFKIAWVILCFF